MSSAPETELSIDGGGSPAAGPTLAGGGGSGLLPGLATVRTAVASMIEAARSTDNGEAVRRHCLEYGEPSVWLWRRIVGAAFAFIVVTLGWYLIKIPDGLISDETLPTQSQVAAAFNEVRSDGFGGATLGRHVGISLFRLSSALAVGSAIGVAWGFLAGSAPLARTVTDPIASFFRMVPAMAMAPLLLLWFGAGEWAIVGVVTFSVLWTSVGATSDARIRSLRGSVSDLPSEIISGMRSALLVGWATVLAVETVVAPTGLGAMIWSGQARGDMIIVGIYIAGVMGFVLDTALRAAQYFLATCRSAAATEPH